MSSHKRMLIETTDDSAFGESSPHVHMTAKPANHSFSFHPISPLERGKLSMGPERERPSSGFSKYTLSNTANSYAISSSSKVSRPGSAPMFGSNIPNKRPLARPQTASNRRPTSPTNPHALANYMSNTPKSPSKDTTFMLQGKHIEPAFDTPSHICLLKRDFVSSNATGLSSLGEEKRIPSPNAFANVTDPSRLSIGEYPGAPLSFSSTLDEKELMSSWISPSTLHTTSSTCPPEKKLPIPSQSKRQLVVSSHTTARPASRSSDSTTYSVPYRSSSCCLSPKSCSLQVDSGGDVLNKVGTFSAWPKRPSSAFIRKMSEYYGCPSSDDDY